MHVKGLRPARLGLACRLRLLTRGPLSMEN